MRSGKQLAVLVLAALLLIGAAANRGFEYDEAYSVFVTSPTPRPQWPSAVFRAGDVRAAFTSHAGPLAIARALRQTDVHPPLYFWMLAAWRWIAGDGLLRMRLLSVLCALASLIAVGAIAREARIDPALAMLLTVGSYGFAYTSVVARGFAVAQMLDVVGVLLVLRAVRPRAALAAGMLLGAATFTNYLSVFTGGAAIAWLLATRPRLSTPAALGFAMFLPGDAWFFAAQHGSRAGQFPPFRLGASVMRIGEYATANLFGGLPLYVGGSARSCVVAILAATMLGLIGLVAWNWRHRGGAARWLFLGCVTATPLGLLVLGAVFDNTPIELRYLCFATPFSALLLADALTSQSWTPPPPNPLPQAGGGTHCCSPSRLREGVRGRGLASARTWVLALQAIAIAGLILRPETMQPVRAAAHAAAGLAGADGVVVLPRGNDGVGVAGPFLAELPDRTRVLLVAEGDTSASVRARLSGSPVVLALLGQDAASRAALPIMRAACRPTTDSATVVVAECVRPPPPVPATPPR